MSSIGIDFGSTNCRAACVDGEGIPRIIPDRSNCRSFCTPAAVSIDDSLCWIGDGAIQRIAEPSQSLPIRFAKLRLGSSSPIHHDDGNRGWTAEAINSLILRKLWLDAKASLTDARCNVVVTMPGYFKSHQRTALRRAAYLAGLPSAMITQDAVAAARYLTLGNQNPQTILIYDLGGGGCQVSLFRWAPGATELVSYVHDTRIGGHWIDQALEDLLAAEFVRLHGFDPREKPSLKCALWSMAESLKLQVCCSQQPVIRESRAVGGFPLRYMLAQTHFGKMIEPMLHQSVNACHICLEKGNLSTDQVDRVFLVGASCQAPHIQRFLFANLGIDPARIQCRHSARAVAYGAALLATDRAQSNNTGGATYELGFRGRDGRSGALTIIPIVRKSDPVPGKTEREFQTSRDGQQQILFELVERRHR